MTLNIRAFALAFAVWSAGGLFLLTWWLILLGAGPGTMSFLETAYPGYSMTAAGSLAGMVWAAIDGAVFGAVLAWLYNVFTRKFAESSA